MAKKFFSLFLLISLIALTACNKDESAGYDVNLYDGAASAGDVISFTVNETVGGFTVYNETSKRYDNGSFTVYTGDLNGLYKVYVNGAFYYAVEMKGIMFSGNFPTARLYNRLSYGISQNFRAENPLVPGIYVYMRITNASVNGSTLNKEWGLLGIEAGGTWRRQPFCNDTGSIQRLLPEEYTGPVSLANAPDSGTWQVATLKPDRFIMTQYNRADSLTGFSYALDTGAVFIMDLGYNKGFLLGMKLLDGDLNKIRGNYGFADSRSDGTEGGGKYTVIDSSKVVEWRRADAFGKIRSGSFGVLNQCTSLKNVFFAKNVIVDTDTVDYYAFTSGPFFMALQLRANKFRSYSTGARLP